MNHRDVIVVGAGVVGCGIAFHLARRGARVRVFDKGEVCAGMSARSGALIRMHYTFGPEAALAWKSLAVFEHWSEMVGGECGFVRTGCVTVVGTDNAERLRRNVAKLQSLGVETWVLDGAQLRELQPQLRTEDVALAAWEPRSGYADPVATTRSFAEAARRAGVEFLLSTPIASIATRGAAACGVTDAAGGRHEAEAVVVAAGPWSDRLLAPLGAALGLHTERGQITFFSRPQTLKHCACIDLVVGSYFRPHGTDLTLAGLGGWDPDPAPDPDRFREAEDPDFVEGIRARLGRRLPAMASSPRFGGRAGIYDMSPDSRSILGAIPEIAGLYVAAGFSGTGFKTSPAVGAAMAELIADGQSTSADISAFGFERLRSGRLIAPQDEYVTPAGFGHKL